MKRLDDIVLGGADLPPLILVLEDDMRSQSLYVRYVEEAGYEVAAMESVPDAVRYVQRFGLPNLALVDISLRGPETGFDFCEKLHAISDIPIIFLSGDDRQDTIVVGLDKFGADYMVKPINPRELIARIKRILRLHGRHPRQSVVRMGGASVDFANREVHRNGTTAAMGNIDTKILYILHRNSGRVVPTAQIIRSVWYEDDSDTARGRLRVYIHKLKNAHGFTEIQTALGVGYMFVDSEL